MTSRQRAWLLPALSPFLAAGVLLGRLLTVPLWALLACFPAAAAVWLLRGRLRFAACLVLVWVLGCFGGSLAYHPALPDPGDYEVSGIIAGELRPGAHGRTSVPLSDVSLNGVPFSAGAYWSFYMDPLPDSLEPGRFVSFRASLYHPSGAENPDSYDFREEMLRRGITVGVFGASDLSVSAPPYFSFYGFTASLRHRLSAALAQRLGEEAGSYASALLLGIRGDLSTEDRAAFARLGIAHVLSVSGFHVGILAAMLAFLFRFLGLPQRVRLLLSGLLLFLYAALCGLNQPVLRASMLVLSAMLGKMLNRPRSGLHLLSLSFCILLLISPVQLTGVSFQMTFLAMLGLTLVTPWLNSRCPFRRKLLRRFWSSLSVYIGAQLGVFLPVLSTYQSFPLLGIVLNLPAALISSFIIAAYWLVLLLLPVPLLSAPAAALLSGFSAPLLQLIRRLGALPGITLWTPAPTMLSVFGVAGLLLSLSYLLRLRPRFRLPLAGFSALILLISLLPWPHTSTEYIQFSAGNADAAVLWDRDKVFVMDTGYADGTVSGFLRRNRLTPDAVILTHLHTDHAAGLQSLLDEGIPVPLVYLPWGAEKAEIHESMAELLGRLRENGTVIRTFSRGDRLSLPSGSVTVLWPEAGKVRPGQDANNSSLVTLLNLGGTTMLHASDLTGLYEMYTACPADILKMAHHGSASSTSQEFLRSVSPQMVLLSCDRMNRHQSVQERVNGIPLYSTAACGALTLHFQNQAWTVEPYLKSELEVCTDGSQGI